METYKHINNRNNIVLLVKSLCDCLSMLLEQWEASVGPKHYSWFSEDVHRHYVANPKCYAKALNDKAWKDKQ